MPRAEMTCPTCRTEVLRAVDVDTGEQLLVDAAPVDQGHIEVWTAGGRASARRHGAPARRQPAHEPHRCAVVSPPAPLDPYADRTPAEQQHGGRR